MIDLTTLHVLKKKSAQSVTKFADLRVIYV